jgi:hypothetical protein
MVYSKHFSSVRFNIFYEKLFRNTSFPAFPNQYKEFGYFLGYLSQLYENLCEKDSRYFSSMEISLF